MKEIKIQFYREKKLLPSDEPEKTYKFFAKCLKMTKK